jgi:hypothetical protein
MIFLKIILIIKLTFVAHEDPVKPVKHEQIFPVAQSPFPLQLLKVEQFGVI